MKLYYCDTLSPRKACAVARYLKVPVEFIYVNLREGEHRTNAFAAINPNCKVPVLTDGDHTLWEANAIMCYLAHKAGSDLWPDDARQIEIMRWLSWDADHFRPYAGTLYFEHLIKPRFGMGNPDPAAVEQALAKFRNYAAVLNDHLKDRRYLVGDGLSVADFAVAATLPYAAEIGLPLAEFPQMQHWHNRLEELDAWRMPFPPRTRE
jgi:glutathione S-transferase